MSGDDVVELQNALNSVLGKELVADGKYGQKTYATVREFQILKGLSVDGVAGPKTQSALSDSF